MSLISSQASAVSASDSKEPGYEPSRSARSSRGVEQSSNSGGPASQSTKTCELLPLSALRQMELFPMSSVAASPAKTSAKLESVPVSAANDPGYGRISLGSLMSFDQNTCLWKMSKPSRDGDCTASCPILPYSGMMRNGTVLGLTSWAPASIANDSGFWHTPTTRDYKGQSGAGNRKRRGRGGRLHIANLCDQLWDTGRLDLVRSPTFREWLMGLPIGHTVLKQSETPSSPRSPSLSVKP